MCSDVRDLKLLTSMHTYSHTELRHSHSDYVKGADFGECVSPGDRGAGAVGAGSLPGGGETPKPGGGAGPGEPGLAQRLPPVGEPTGGQGTGPGLPAGPELSTNVLSNNTTQYTTHLSVFVSPPGDASSASGAERRERLGHHGRSQSHQPRV